MGTTYKVATRQDTLTTNCHLQGVLLRSAAVLDDLLSCTVVAVDKTGTVTRGALALVDTQQLALGLTSDYSAPPTHQAPGVSYGSGECRGCEGCGGHGGCGVMQDSLSESESPLPTCPSTLAAVDVNKTSR